MPVNRITQLILLLAVPTGIAVALSSISMAVPPAGSNPDTGVLTTLDPEAWINIRSDPSTDAQSIERGFSGEPVEVLRSQQGMDGFTWYLVRSSRLRTQGWVRGDLVRMVAPPMPLTAAAPAPVAESRGAESRSAESNPFPEYDPMPVGSATSPNPFARTRSLESRTPEEAPSEAVLENGQAPMPYQPPQPDRFAAPVSPAPMNAASMPYQQREQVFEQSQSAVAPQPVIPADSSAPSAVPAPPPANAASTAWLPDRPQNPLRPTPYTNEQIQYFLEVALGAEFGETGGTVRKWNGPIRIRVQGTPTREDLATLNAVVAELNELTNGITLELSNSSANIDLHFAPESQFRNLEPNYRPRNLGFFWTWWNGGEIYRARILISTTGVTQRERSHLIREELTQSLGLMRDSNRYPDSIFYQGWTEVNQYTPTDRAIISMLYRPEVRAGMSRTEVLTALRNLTEDRTASTCGIQLPFALPFIGQRIVFPGQTCNVQ